ncbi:hypothetical protein N9W79_00655 [bacterium]|nr:hypothetical protein [bacterium]
MLNIRGREDIFSPKSSKYCIGIPLLNEGSRIKTQLEKMNALGIPDIYDVLIFDGNSTDNCCNLELMKRLNVRGVITKLSEGKQGTQFQLGFDFALREGKW